MPRAARRQRFWTLLVLGRVSNLPTVWSDCLAAWLIAASGARGRLAVFLAAATFLYLGGMFLNDAFDVTFDLEHRPERPIPSGLIQRRAVWAAGFAGLGLGWLAASSQGVSSSLVAMILLLAIVIYDWRHKKTRAAPWLMASCRLLLYLLAASAVGPKHLGTVALPGLGLAAYILGLSCLARVESTRGKAPRWATWLLFTPVILALALQGGISASTWVAAACLTAWVCWCLAHRNRPAQAFFKAGVAGLLAGIPLLDWLNAAAHAPGGGAVFVGLFLLALCLQRWAPAT